MSSPFNWRDGTPSILAAQFATKKTGPVAPPPAAQPPRLRGSKKTAFDWTTTPSAIDTRDLAHVKHRQAIAAHRTGVPQPLPRVSINTERQESEARTAAMQRTSGCV